ncbi:hypothetical protein [Sinimarinibacterium sp. NLF-5-8]|uniref:hypothetical protein n=1 Tax=Sinimarinibacterium sp. NLF-5-8 TaxID=2698684 RepID=UPI00137BCE48|nr:hypothetical protein [Sinimarinibacterium sp. NLF-5-8]QHS09678.1 hypothetical protein GT972_05565 [Sinimarinibacterium sp. NLF-5-8]
MNKGFLPCLLTSAVAAALAACAQQPLPPPAAADLPNAAPSTACSTTRIGKAPLLRLPETRHDKAEEGAFAQKIKLNKSLTRAGAWMDAGGQWSILHLSLQSVGARSLAVQLDELQLPRQAEVFWCSADGVQRKGPYRKISSGELQTSVIKGNQAYLELWIPSVYKSTIKGRLQSAEGGYQ